VCGRWDFKARNFDSVLLFKMGKFYEMFEMDAHTGAEVLGLVHMKVVPSLPTLYGGGGRCSIAHCLEQISMQVWGVTICF
jgi:DNA mismatch repair ATPase MutS